MSATFRRLVLTEPWFGEGFLYVGYAALRRGGKQNELAGLACRWQEHLANHARGDTAEADKIRYRMAKEERHLESCKNMIVQVADIPEARPMESTAIATISPNAKRTKNQKGGTQTQRRKKRKEDDRGTEQGPRSHVSPPPPPRDMGPERAARTSQARDDERNGQHSDHADLAKPSPATEGNPMVNMGRSLVVEKKLQ